MRYNSSELMAKDRIGMCFDEPFRKVKRKKSIKNQKSITETKVINCVDYINVRAKMDRSLESDPRWI